MDSTHATDPGGAPVRVLPPLVFLAPLAAGLALHRVRPLPLPADRLWRRPGLALAAGGLAFMGWAFDTMRRSHTTIVPWDAPSVLVTEGPFRLSRNPIYLGDLLVYAGVTLRAGSCWPAVLLPGALAAMQRLVIGPEERYLAVRFGADYAAYRERVRRWL